MANYLTRAEADTYFLDSLSAGSWLTASNGDKDKALTMATRLINTLSFRGSKSDSEQANEFPRGENSYTPQEVAWACAEIALCFIDGFDPNKERENLTVLGEKIDSVASSYSERHKEQWRVTGVPSIVAWNYLLPFLAGKTSLTLFRVN